VNTSRDKDYSGLKFEVAQLMGDPMDCYFFKLNAKKPDKEQRFHFHHSKYDGLGAFAKINEQHSKKEFEFPLLRHSKKPGLFKKIKLFIKFSKVSSQIPLQWIKGKNLGKRGAPKSCILLQFDPQTTRNIYKNIKEKKLGPTSIFLNSLDKALRNDLVEDSSTTKWFSPINMRTKDLGEEKRYSNQAASVVLEMNKNQSNEEINEQFKKYLKNDLHWGSWLYTNLGKYIGLKGLAWLAGKKVQGYTGIFSNMGKWPSISPSETYHYWTVLAPCSVILPVGATSLCVGEHLCLSLQIHPSLNVDKEFLSKLGQKWGNVLLNSLNLEENEFHIRLIDGEQQSELPTVELQ
jgi:hypothetical protein